MMALSRQSGQAMTEFTVAAAFVVVPLFIIVPVVGKYIDMKLSAIQGSRYAVWEYTVNYESSGEAGFRQGMQPRKTKGQVQKEAERRFYSNTALPIDSVGDRSGYDEGDANPFWRYHNGLPIYRPSGNTTLKVSGSENTPDTTGLARRFMKAFGAAASSLGSLLQAIGVDVNFDAIDTRGKYRVGTALPVQPAPLYAGLDAADQRPLFGQPLNLEMKANAAVLGQSWSAGGKAHTVYRVGGLVPTAITGKVYSTVMGPVFSVLRQIPLLNVGVKEFDPKNLVFGYPVGDPQVMDEVPPGKLEGDTRKLQCEGGDCVY